MPLLQSDCSQPDRIGLIAMAHAGTGDYDAALAAVADGLARHPRSVPLWLHAATFWMAKSHWAAATACVDRAAGLDPARPAVVAMRQQLALAPPATLPLPDRWRQLWTKDVAPPTLGVCLIVRDEAHQIAACLASVQGADEVVVIDTGSTDATPDIARGAGALVHRATWTGDFAAARNNALGHVTTDWVLVIDADERLEGGLAAVRQSIDDHGGDQTVLCPMVVNQASGRQGHTLFRVGRCFANRLNHRFKGRIHERVVSTDGEPIVEWAVDSWRLRHDGYDGTLTQRRAKTERNLALMRRWLAEAPGDPDAHYYFGLELAATGDLRGASAELHAAFEGFADEASRSLALLHHLIVLETAGRLKDVVMLGEAYHGLCGHMPDFWLTMGVAYESIGRTDKARACFQAAAQAPADGSVVFETDGARTWKPHLYLAQLAAVAGDPAAVMAHVQPLMPIFGHQPRLACLYVYGLVAQGHLAEAEAAMAQALAEPMTADEVADGMLRVLERSGDVARPVIERLHQHPGAYRTLCHRYMVTQDWSGLLRLARDMAGVVGAQAWLHQGFACAELGLASEAEAAFRRATREDPALVLAWHNLGVLLVERGDWQEARQAFETALVLEPTSVPVMTELVAVLGRLGEPNSALPFLAKSQTEGTDQPDLECQPSRLD